MGEEYGASLMAITERGNGQEARARPEPGPEERRDQREPPVNDRMDDHPDDYAADHADDADERADGRAGDRADDRAEGIEALLGDPRARRWLIRGAAAVVALVAGLVLIDLRAGFTLAVLVVIADVVRVTRKSSSVPAWQKSSAAERRTEKQLKALERRGYLVLHARAVPRDDDGVSDGRIDHLVIGPSGVYAIDSEKWDKRLPVRTLSHLKLFHGPVNKKDRLDEARWEAEQASKILAGRVGFEVPVQPSVAIYGPSIPWKVMRVRDVDVYAGNRARAYLRRRPKILTDIDVQRIFQAADKALPPKYPV